VLTVVPTCLGAHTVRRQRRSGREEPALARWDCKPAAMPAGERPVQASRTWRQEGHPSGASAAEAAQVRAAVEAAQEEPGTNTCKHVFVKTAVRRAYSLGRRLVLGVPGRVHVGRVGRRRLGGIHRLHLPVVGLLHGHRILVVGDWRILRLLCPGLLRPEGAVEMPGVKAIRVVPPLLVLASLVGVRLVLG
jgi:hypothetical protein